ncbi:MAG: hypothetical protein PHF97_03040 [Bacteroidales bacterium]|nr:hypothetical protein [Bacteroidales bacterium]MDD4602769.1 hypothetical protein [Bacteroidales bacterium]
MAAKKVFMLRLDPAVYEALEKWAADEFRSVNGQIEWIIDAKLKEHKKTPKKKPDQEKEPVTG